VLRDALAAPRRSPDSIGTTVVGGALTAATLVAVPLWLGAAAATPAALAAAPLALAPALLLRGYYLRTVGAGLARRPAAPSFVGWGRLYRDGLKSAVLTAAYLLPLACVLAVGGIAAAGIESGRVDAGPVAEPLAAAALAFLGVFTLAYLVAFAYLRPAALARLAATGRLRAAFAPRRVGRVAVDGDYATAWLLAAGVGLTGGAIATATLPLLVGLPLWFAVRTVGHSLYGRGAAGGVGGDAAGGGAAAPGRDPATADPDADAESRPTVVADPGDPAAGGRSGEAAPSVQVGRGVPLTATDVLADAPGAAGAGGADGPSGATDDGWRWAGREGRGAGGDEGRGREADAGTGEPRDADPGTSG